MNYYLSRGWRWFLASCLFLGLLATTTNIHNWPVSLAAMILASLMMIFSQTMANQVNQIPRKTFFYLILIILLVMFIGQSLILSQLPITVYHDPFRMLHQALQLASGQQSWQSSTYFWRYPNNAVPAIFLSRWFILTNAMHLSANVSLMILQMIMLDGFIILTIATIWQSSHRQSMVAATTAFCALTPFGYTYFLNVAYTDLPNMIILLVIFRTIYFWSNHSRQGRTWESLLLVIVSMLAMLIKGNFIVMMPAIILTVLTCRMWRKASRQLTVPLVAIIIGILISLPVGKIIEQQAGFSHNNSYEFPATAWVAMGLNAHTSGTYSSHDVDKMIALPTKTTRQRVAQHKIARRLAKDGAPGIAKLFLAKDGIMMNATDISQWYSGGHRQAPSWWIQHGILIETSLSLLYQTAWAALVLMAIRNLFQRYTGKQPATVLAILTALGYLAFHILLWEVEGRYGQVLLPLLIFTLATNKGGVHDPQRYGSWSYPIVTMAAALLCSGLLTHYRAPARAIEDVSTNAAVVAAQRSQLSSQYKARPTNVAPGQIVTQQLRLNAPAQQFFILVANHSKLDVQLFNLQSGQHYRLHQQQQDFLVLQRKLPAGNYQIVIINHSGKIQPLAITHARNYQLARQPLINNGFPENDASLIYTAWK